MNDDPAVTGENTSDLALVSFRQEFNAHSGIISDILFGSGSAGLGLSKLFRLPAPAPQKVKHEDNGGRDLSADGVRAGRRFVVVGGEGV